MGGMSETNPNPAEPTRTVIVLVAMEDEAVPFLRRAERTGEPETAGASVVRSIEIDGLPIRLVQTGIGFVNAASATTAAILWARAAHPEAVPVVFSAGTAGGLGAGVEVGDVVVGSEYINIDADARVFGYRLGQVPGMPESYRADPRMLAAVELASPPEGDGWHVRPGLIASSYSFVTADRADIARTEFPGVAAVDMESSAIAQVCYSNGVPFASVRGISDLASATAPVDHVDNTSSTAERSSRVLIALAEALRL